MGFWLILQMRFEIMGFWLRFANESFRLWGFVRFANENLKLWGFGSDLQIKVSDYGVLVRFCK